MICKMPKLAKGIWDFPGKMIAGEEHVPSCKYLIWYVVLDHDPSLQILPSKYINNTYQKGHKIVNFSNRFSMPNRSTEVKP